LQFIILYSISFSRKKVGLDKSFQEINNWARHLITTHGKKFEGIPRPTAIFVNDRSFLSINRSMGKKPQRTAVYHTAALTNRGTLNQGCGVFTANSRGLKEVLYSEDRPQNLKATLFHGFVLH
jgi:hypothetical protein